jgi:catechol 2,3-dioxygenase-like lactoylglutathione lyase family enzyme
MITSVHTLIYSDDADATRAFFRDVLGFPNVDAGGGWLIFGTGPSELGVHPTRSEWDGKVYESPKQHTVSLMCDDIAATVAALKAKGAKFASEPTDHGYGLVAMVVVPGAGEMQIYQPKHPLAYEL